MTYETFLVRVDADVAETLDRSASPDAVSRRVDTLDQALEALEAHPERAAVIVLGTGVEDPISVAQRACAVLDSCSVLVLAAPEHYEGLARAVQFSPFLSSGVVCVPADDAVRLDRTFRRLAEQAAQSRAYSSLMASVREQMPSPAPASESSMLYLDRLLDHAPVGVIVVDDEGVIQAWNRRASVIFGRPEREALNGSFEALFPESAREHLRRLLFERAAHDPETQAKTLPLTFERRTEAGTPQYVEITATSLADPRQGQAVMAIVLDATRRVEAEMQARHLGEQAAVAEALARQADHLRQLNTQLEQRNRELQDFSYAASHDLQEPLRKFRTFLGLLDDEIGTASPTVRDYVKRMDASAARMSELISALLSLSRVATRGRRFHPTNLDKVVREVLADLEVSIQESGAKVDVGPLFTIEADPAQMRQLFQNLIGNALKFRREGVPPVIQVRGSVNDGTNGRAGPTLCRLEVQDNGIGFDEKYLEKIFTPFQRLHGRSSYEGTGMGLAICRRIVERYGGTITAHSRPGEGTTFVVMLPKTQPRTDNPE